MSLDLNAIGPPVRGLFLFGEKLTPSTKEGDANPVEGVEPVSMIPLSWERPLNPYTDALRTMENLAHQRRILSGFRAEDSRPTLGAHIDLKA